MKMVLIFTLLVSIGCKAKTPRGINPKNTSPKKVYDNVRNPLVFTKERLNYGMERLENDEVICYGFAQYQGNGGSGGVSCFPKSEDDYPDDDREH